MCSVFQHLSFNIMESRPEKSMRVNFDAQMVPINMIL